MDKNELNTFEYQIKGDFFSNLSSSMRSSISIIKMSFDLIVPRLNAPDSDRTDAYMSMLVHNYHCLMKITNNMGIFGSILNGTFKAEREKTDIIALLSSITSDTALLLPKDTASIEFSSSAVSLLIDTDPAKAEYILLNLLSNSIKYTPAGGKIKVSASVAGDSFIFFVSDNGCGISQDRLNSIFSSPSLAQSLADTKSGMGLGLVIVWEATRALGGQALIESQQGVGTCVSISLPISAQGATSFSSEITSYSRNNMSEILTQLSDVLDASCYTKQFLD